MLAQPTGLTKDIECACGSITSQYHLRSGRTTVWVSKEHKAPCGRPCALSPGSLVGDVHVPGKCELCPTQRKGRKAPRPRVKSETTASPILGQLTINEARVLNYALQARLMEARHWIHAPIISADLKIPDATVRGTLRRLAVRGVVRQEPTSRAWQLTLPANARHEELMPRGQNLPSQEPHRVASSVENQPPVQEVQEPPAPVTEGQPGVGGTWTFPDA